MDIWEELYQAAKPYYHPTAVNDFIYTHNVVCALQRSIPDTVSKRYLGS